MEALLWIRVGDAGEYEEFNDLDAAIDYLNELRVGKVTTWREAGFSTANYRGQDYISIYWGGYDADYWTDLDDSDKASVEIGLGENYL